MGKMGPKTAEGIERCREAGRAQGQFTRHGLYTVAAGGPFPGCDLCIVKDRCPSYAEGGPCVEAAHAMEEILVDLKAIPHLAGTPAPRLADYARLEVALELFDQHIRIKGIFVEREEEVRVSGLWDQRMKISAALDRKAVDLGLTPTSQSRLRLERKGGALDTMARMIVELEEERRGDAEEGEFEAEGEGASPPDPLSSIAASELAAPQEEGEGETAETEF